MSAQYSHVLFRLKSSQGSLKRGEGQGARKVLGDFLREEVTNLGPSYVLDVLQSDFR